MKCILFNNIYNRLFFILSLSKITIDSFLIIMLVTEQTVSDQSGSYVKNYMGEVLGNAFWQLVLYGVILLLECIIIYSILFVKKCLNAYDSYLMLVSIASQLFIVFFSLGSILRT